MISCTGVTRWCRSCIFFVHEELLKSLSFSFLVRVTDFFKCPPSQQLVRRFILGNHRHSRNKLTIAAKTVAIISIINTYCHRGTINPAKKGPSAAPWRWENKSIMYPWIHSFIVRIVAIRSVRAFLFNLLDFEMSYKYENNSMKEENAQSERFQSMCKCTNSR